MEISCSKWDAMLCTHFFKDCSLLSLVQGRLVGLRCLGDCLWLSRETICLILAKLNQSGSQGQ